MRVYQVFPIYPQNYQPYNQRLVKALKTIDNLDIEVISHVGVKFSREKDIIYVNSKSVGAKLQKFRNGLILFLKKGKFEDRGIIKSLKVYGRYYHFINNSNSIFHFHNLHSIKSELLTILIRERIKYIVSLRGHDITIKPIVNEETLNHTIAVLKNAWKVHSVCESLKKDAVALSKVNPQKIKVIYRTPNLQKREQIEILKKLPKEINIFTISRIHWKKCVSESLIAVSKLKKHGFLIKYHIIGGFQGYEKDRLLFLIHKLNLKDNVVLYGYLGEDQYMEILNKMHIFWFPTINEGLPNTLYFALKSGIPIIATKTDGIPELIKNEINGLLFEPYDFNELFEKTKRVIQDDSLRKNLQTNARNTEIQSLEQEISQYMDLYIS